MLPPPPARFMMLSVVGRILFAVHTRSIVRAVLSLLPPGGLGTTSSTLRCGDHCCCAAAIVAVTLMSTAASHLAYFIATPSVGFAESYRVGQDPIIHRRRRMSHERRAKQGAGRKRGAGHGGSTEHRPLDRAGAGGRRRCRC